MGVILVSRRVTICVFLIPSQVEASMYTTRKENTPIHDILTSPPILSDVKTMPQLLSRHLQQEKTKKPKNEKILEKISSMG